MVANRTFMTRALEIARTGQGRVHPNPLVGAVIVKDGNIIGEGAHQSYGESHAEVLALRDCSVSPENATMYVNLEPCTYHGKTPPCVPEIIEAGIRRIVIGMPDPNPKVDGEGIRQLREAGITVDAFVMEDEARRMNFGFVHTMKTGYPWVTLKLALTIDGFMADSHGNSKWITNDTSRALVHQWRSEHNAVLVGAGTYLIDQPRLTVRRVSGPDPLRVILDAEGVVDPSPDQMKVPVPETIFMRSKNHENGHLNHSAIGTITLQLNEQGRFDWKDILQALYWEKGILSVFVEGGAQVASSLLESGRVNELIIMTAAKIIGDGLSPFSGLSLPMDNPSRWTLTSVAEIDGDVCIRYTPAQESD